MSIAHSEEIASAAPSKTLPTITWGVLGDSLSAAYNLPIEQGWVSLVQKESEQHFIGRASVKMLNVSVSGATTEAGFSLLPGLMAQRPDIVVLELGANDGLQGKPLPLIHQNLNQLLLHIQRGGADTLLVGVRLPPNLGQRYTEPFYRQFETLAGEYNIPLITFERDTSETGADLMLADGLHPNAKGHQTLAELIWPYIKDAIEKRLSHKSLAINKAGY